MNIDDKVQIVNLDSIEDLENEQIGDIGTIVDIKSGNRFNILVKLYNMYQYLYCESHLKVIEKYQKPRLIIKPYRIVRWMKGELV